MILIPALIDALLFGYLWKQKNNPYAVFIFGNSSWFYYYDIKNAREVYPLYRIVMFLLDCFIGYMTYILLGWIGLTIYLLSSYFPVKDSIFYTLLGQWNYLFDKHGSKELYWLCYPFQAGFWLFKNGFEFYKLLIVGSLGILLNVAVIIFKVFKII